jgi:hypothetical protein
MSLLRHVPHSLKNLANLFRHIRLPAPKTAAQQRRVLICMSGKRLF